jgi:hypothetical protein
MERFRFSPMSNFVNLAREEAQHNRELTQSYLNESQYSSRTQGKSTFPNFDHGEFSSFPFARPEVE